jgi:hypothetical protein
LLSLVVQQEAVALLFGIVSILLFAIDLVWEKYVPQDRVARVRLGSTL